MNIINCIWRLPDSSKRPELLDVSAERGFVHGCHRVRPVRGHNRLAWGAEEYPRAARDRVSSGAPLWRDAESAVERRYLWKLRCAAVATTCPDRRPGRGFLAALDDASVGKHFCSASMRIALRPTASRKARVYHKQ